MTEERKLVTVLFADIVGSTALGSSHDPEVVRRTLSRAFSEVRHALETHGGTVEKFIGDAVMAVFGIPHTHDDAFFDSPATPFERQRTEALLQRCATVPL